MEYREIVAVTGLSGLYQLLTTKSDGAIVRSVSEKTTKFISARQHNVTPLESIEIYTTGENVRLQDVFRKMLESEGTTAPVDPKSADNNAIKNYFKSILPDFDDERVYVSDMKKMLKWYDLLKANDLLKFEEPKEEAESAAEETQVTTPADESSIVAEAETAPAEAKPKKAPKKKKAEAPASAEGDATPPKKTARKKKTEE